MPLEKQAELRERANAAKKRRLNSLSEEDRHLYLLKQRARYVKWKAANPGQQKVYNDKGRQQKKAEGICIYCTKPRMDTSTTSCESHWFKAIAKRTFGCTTYAARLREMLISQNYTCPYTGAKLTPGANCWLDHIRPVSRFPELKSSIENVEWVSALANKAKTNMTKDEFLAFCANVIARQAAA